MTAVAQRRTARLPDPRVALEVANRRKATRRELRDACREAGDREGARLLARALLAEPPAPEFAESYAWRLLRYVPLIRDQKAARMCRRARIDSWTKVSQLTIRQRHALAAELTAFASRPTPAEAKRAASRRYQAGQRDGRLRIPHKGPRCPACDEPMIEPAPLCGFCEAEKQGSA